MDSASGGESTVMCSVALVMNRVMAFLYSGVSDVVFDFHHETVLKSLMVPSSETTKT